MAQDIARPDLGLMGTVPVYWGEVGGLEDVLAAKSEPHWARARLEERYVLRPLDYLSEEALADLGYLLLAQPRALSGEENVALDAWVRRGGHLLLFADPMMTGHTAFPLGDRRRPHDVTLLSPILAHWGLAMEFDAARPPEPESVETGGLTVPVNLPGRFSLSGSGDEVCRIDADRVLARCAIGEGTATILADAAVLDLHEPDPGAAAALEALVGEAFGSSGENAGSEDEPR